MIRIRVRQSDTGFTLEVQFEAPDAGTSHRWIQVATWRYQSQALEYAKAEFCAGE